MANQQTAPAALAAAESTPSAQVVLDYRRRMKYGKDDCFRDAFPEVKKTCLRMTTETGVKDIASISDYSWTYNDLLQAEARVTKVLHPVLHLGTDPSLDRLCATGSKQTWTDKTEEMYQSVSHEETTVQFMYTSNPPLVGCG